MYIYSKPVSGLSAIGQQSLLNRIGRESNAATQRTWRAEVRAKLREDRKRTLSVSEPTSRHTDVPNCA